ncbi:MAG: preprotein translocase subunit YajC [Lachnospiraceae bacterium]
MNLLAAAEGSASGSWMVLILYIVIFGAFMYFIAIRPQKKEQKRLDEMHSAMAIGDAIVTTGGFYGIIIDLTEEDVIVEFGNNKNCRIPMKKEAIAQVEKAM